MFLWELKSPLGDLGVVEIVDFYPYLKLLKPLNVKLLHYFVLYTIFTIFAAIIEKQPTKNIFFAYGIEARTRFVCAS